MKKGYRKNPSRVVGGIGKNKTSKLPSGPREVTKNTNQTLVPRAERMYRKNTVKKYKDVPPGRTGRDRKVQRGKGG